MLKSFTYKSSVVSYTVKGEGSCVVLLHGFGEDSHVWDNQVQFLRQNFQVIVPDIPGSGLSTLLDQEHVTIEDYADCVYSLLTNEKISCCTMLGHSMGGYITLAFAEKHHDMLNGFGLVHSTAFADTEEKKKTREKAIVFIEQYGAHAFLKTSIPGLFGNEFKHSHPEKINELIDSGEKFSKKALQQYYKAMMSRRDRPDILRLTPLPVLFIIGTEDIAAPADDVLKQVHLPARSYIHILEGAGHMGIWEEAERVNGYIDEFLRDVAAYR